MMTPASDVPAALDPAHDVVVAGGAYVIHSDRPLSEFEQQSVRNHFQTTGDDVEAGLVLGNAMHEAMEKMLEHFDAHAAAALEGVDA